MKTVKIINRLFRVGIFGSIVAVILTGCSMMGTTIRPGTMGIKYIALDEEGLKSEVKSEGFYFQWPWNDIVRYDVTLQTRDEVVEVLTDDDLHVPVTVSLTFRPVVSKIRQLHLELGPGYYADVIRPKFSTLVRSEFARHLHNDLARNSVEIEHAILKNLRLSLIGKPLELDGVSIKHIRFDPKVTASISDKLAMEQRAEQKQFELKIAKQDAEIARTAAKGRGDSMSISAKGEAEAIVIKGKAQADAQKAIAQTLTHSYLQYKAFDSDSTRYYFVPVGKDGMPIIINAE